MIFKIKAEPCRNFLKTDPILMQSSAHVVPDTAPPTTSALFGHKQKAPLHALYAVCFARISPVLCSSIIYILQLCFEDHIHIFISKLVQPSQMV